MPAKKYVVKLEPEERAHLDGLVRSGKRSALTITVLLLADAAEDGPAWDDAWVAEALRCGVRTVERGPEAALGRKPQDRPSREGTPDGAAEARLIAPACSAPPEGRARWTLKLLANRLVELDVVGAVSDGTVRRALKKRAEDAPQAAVGHPPTEAGGEFVARMEDVLEVYHRPYSVILSGIFLCSGTCAIGAIGP